MLSIFLNVCKNLMDYIRKICISRGGGPDIKNRGNSTYRQVLYYRYFTGTLLPLLNPENNSLNVSVCAKPPEIQQIDTVRKNATTTDRDTQYSLFDTPPPKQFLNDTDSLYFNKSDSTTNYLNETYSNKTLNENLKKY